jgi:hypothetical protein
MAGWRGPGRWESANVQDLLVLLASLRALWSVPGEDRCPMVGRLGRTLAVGTLGEALIDAAHGTDVFVCTTGASDQDTGLRHCTPEDAAAVAVRAGALQLVITHPAAGMALQQSADRALAAGARVAVAARSGQVTEIRG